MKHTTSLDGDSFWCQDCRIKELEAKIVDLDDTVGNLRNLLDTAKADLWEERNKPCPGCGL